ncbi:amino acid adenylation domain-containing protein [Nonomuraea sp. NPDC052265]|uniref:amino acid adenylation domain-containing protein n=1 Tax=Nonomuraea sp. NPDC052265 TaxID=3364374 RepID=UPI0037CBC76E
MSLLLPEWFLRTAARHPHEPAVLHEGGVTTYQELERSARQIAGALAGRGVKPEDVIGVMMRPGPDLVAALCGIWLAGACYLPLDAHAPADRLRLTIERAGPRLVVTDLVEPAPGLSPRLTVDVHRLRDKGILWTPGGDTPPGRAAYVIFTSGSTGVPKGVVIEHAGIANRVRWAVDTLKLTAEDRILQKTPLTFDAAGWEIFGPLVCGGAVTFGRHDAGQDAGELVRSIVERQATVVQVVPTMLQQLAAEPELRTCSSLRRVCSAGEPLTAELCRQVRAQVEVEIWNTYGPTECSIDVLAARFDPGQESGPVPIGSPIDNIRCVLAPTDAPGLHELYAAGVGVGRGYLGDPAQTAERFVPDASGPAGSRMYRTGDLVRLRPDGSHEFAGRVDEQVKINGIRIEPGEIEVALLAHPEVTEAVVRAVTGPHGVRRLAAWVVTARPGTSADLPLFLRETLPHTFVPTVVTEVDRLPRTSSGKTDRAALPEPAWAAIPPVPPTASGPADALTAEQRIVLATWRELLGTTEIGLDDDFAALGGHSLMIARLASRLADASKLDLEFRELHFATTPRAQAELLHRAVQARPIEPLPAGARLPLSPVQERFWVLDRMDPGSREYLMPIALRLPAGTGADAVENALGRLVARHDVLRSRYVMDADGLTSIIEPEVPVPLRTVDLTADELPQRLAEEVAGGFDLASAPLLRAILLRIEGQEQLLLLVCHHIICDGWSAGLLERDLHALLSDPAGDVPARSGPRYVDAVAWQRSQLTDEVRDEQLAYWRSTLAELPPLGLPTAVPREAYRRIDGAVTGVGLPPEVATALVTVGRTVGATSHATLLTLWTVVLARLAGHWDFGVGVPHAGRTRPELHDIVGPFLNTVVIRARLTPEMTFMEALAHVGRMCREAFVRHSVPFEMVVDAVAPHRDFSHTPLAQSYFTVVGEGGVGIRPREGDAELLARFWSVSRTDVALTMWPAEDGGYGGVLEYASALFPAGLGQDISRRLSILAERLATTPDSAIGAPGLDTGDEEPPYETDILGHVRELLDQPDIGADDDVMRAGGSSLSVSRLLWHVQSTYGVEVSMRAFFDRPTAADLARVVAERLRDTRHRPGNER